MNTTLNDRLRILQNKNKLQGTIQLNNQKKRSSGYEVRTVERKFTNIKILNGIVKYE